MLDSLKLHAPPGLRWMHPDDLHLTLAFFGKLERSHVPAINRTLRSVPFDSLDVALGALLPLPRPNHFTALSFELTRGKRELMNYIARWRDPLLAAAELSPDPRTPWPHLTIARPQRKNPAFDAQAITRWSRSIKPPARPILLSPPALYGWVDNYQEAVHEGTARYRLID